MPKFFLFLGSFPEISRLEIQSLLPANQSLESINKELLALDLADLPAAQELQSQTGGLIKILQAELELSIDPEISLPAVVDFLIKAELPVFAWTDSAQVFPFTDHDLKKALQATHSGKVRYLATTTRLGLPAAVLLNHPDYYDLLVIKTADKIYLARTVTIQNIDDWTKRDRQKPYASGHKGMLPPKLARMMVNIGLGAWRQLNPLANQQPVVYDPFCGTGTILLEAVMRDCQVMGSDLDSKSVAGTKANLEWFGREINRQISSQIFPAEVTQIKNLNLSQPVNLIISEPFLGKPNPQPTELKGIFKGLGKLYLGAFKAWQSILRPNSVVVIIFPQAQVANGQYNLSALIDKLAEYGYTLHVEPVVYSRELAVIKRQILVFKYQPLR